MPQIEELRRQRAGINEQVQALATIETSGGTLTAEQLTEFTSLQQQFTDITAKIERLEAADRAAALVAKPVKATQQTTGISVKAEPKQYPGAGMTRLVMSIAAAQGNVQDAAKFAAEELNDQSVSMAINTAANSGGVLIPENLHSEVIELLRDRTIIRKLGARSIPLPNGNMALPRLAGGATASYTGEGKDAKVSEARFDDVKLTAKTMIAMVPVSNQLIGRAGFNVEQLVLQDILTAISVREDKAFMRDDGTGDTPVGMKARAPDGERTGSLSIPEITDPEAMEWMEDNLFRVGSEKEGSAWLVNIDILKGTYQLLSSIQLKDYTRPGNKGLEGLAWDKENQVLFAAKEKKPVMISRVDVQSEENSVSTLPTSATTSVRDVSGLHYHSPTASLLVLSDKSGKVLEINREGLVTDRLYLNAGWAGLTQNIPQAEGIALDDAGNLYIVSEPNLFYRFTKKQNGRT